MKTYTLARTGLPPLQFEGELMAKAGDRPDVDPAWTVRWHTSAVYATDSGRLVLLLQFHSDRHDELNQNTVLIASTVTKLAELIDEYDPVEYVADFPAHPRWDKRRDDRARHIENQFDAMISDLMNQAGLTETI